MQALRALLGATGLALLVGACGGSPTPPPAAPPKPPTAAAPAKPAAPGPGAAAPAPAPPQVPTYEAKGRRDPFETLEGREGAGGLTVASTKLTGIVRGRTTLALIEAPDGIGYILKPGDTLGDGRLLEIGSDSVVFAVTPKPGVPTNRVVLKLATN
ncbi:MAG: hypothetical protein HY729_04910 [Candidatus Rokubacteria bacterium]|nr:hypothetical protein [Candidatus Rokubacteria bacterium]